MKSAQEIIEVIYEKALGEMSCYLYDAMAEVGKEWQKRHPKRSVQFIDKQGVCGWRVESSGKMMWVREASWTDERYERVFAELLESEEWYMDITDGIRQLSIDPVYLPVRTPCENP